MSRYYKHTYHVSTLIAVPSHRLLSLGLIRYNVQPIHQIQDRIHHFVDIVPRNWVHSLHLEDSYVDEKK